MKLLIDIDENRFNECKRLLKKSPEFYADSLSGIVANGIVIVNADAINRKAAMDKFNRWAEFKDYSHVERHILHAVVDELRAMPSIGEQPDEWTSILKDLYDGMGS